MRLGQAGVRVKRAPEVALGCREIAVCKLQHAEIVEQLRLVRKAPNTFLKRLARGPRIPVRAQLTSAFKNGVCRTAPWPAQYTVPNPFEKP